MLIFGCIVYPCGSLVMCCPWHGDFPGLTMVSALPCHFLDNHGVVGSPFGFLIGSLGPYGCGLEQTLWKP